MMMNWNNVNGKGKKLLMVFVHFLWVDYVITSLKILQSLKETVTPPDGNTLLYEGYPKNQLQRNFSQEEVFRKMDGLADENVSLQPPVDHWRKFIYCTSLTGQILGSVDHMQPQDFDRTVSPTSVATFFTIQT